MRRTGSMSTPWRVVAVIAIASLVLLAGAGAAGALARDTDDLFPIYDMSSPRVVWVMLGAGFLAAALLIAAARFGRPVRPVQPGDVSPVSPRVIAAGRSGGVSQRSDRSRLRRRASVDDSTATRSQRLTR